MSEHATVPTTAPTPEVNGHPPTAQAEMVEMTARPLPPDPVTGETFLELSPAAAELFADMAWAEKGFEDGRWYVYPDRYIAVFNRTFLGHGDRPDTLREEMAKQYGIDPRRIVIKYIPPPFMC